MALRQLPRFSVGVLLVILHVSTVQRSDGFNLQQWMSTHGSKFSTNRQLASASATGLEHDEDEDDAYINSIILKSCPSGYFRNQEEKCVQLSDVLASSSGGGGAGGYVNSFAGGGGGGGGGYVNSFGGGGLPSCQIGQYLDHSGQCSVCPAECRGDTRSASSSNPGSVTCPHGQYLTASGRCVPIHQILKSGPPRQRKYSSNSSHPDPSASRSLLSPEVGCPPGQQLLQNGRCAPITYPSSRWGSPGGGYAGGSRTLLSPPVDECPPGQFLKPGGECALIPYPPVPGGKSAVTRRSVCPPGKSLKPNGKCTLIKNPLVPMGTCPPGQAPVLPNGQCAPVHPWFHY